MKNLIFSAYFLLMSLFILVSCYGEKGESAPKNFTIDPSIKTEVEKYISNSEFGKASEKTQSFIYKNRLFIDFYENDKLDISSKDSAAMNIIFKSFYYWRKDTLTIVGAFGLFTGFGFSTNIYKGNATVYHLLSSDEIPSYAYKENDSITFRIDVPCTDTKLILSEIPDSTNKQIIYGFVEFKSDAYYASSGTIDDKEILPRKKERANMKIYFKSIYYPL